MLKSYSVIQKRKELKHFLWLFVKDPFSTNLKQIYND